MRLSRREVILGAGAAAAAAGCSGPFKRLAFGPPEELAPPPEFNDPDAVLLNRIGYGPNPREMARLKKAGRDAYVEEQLAASQEEPIELILRLNHLDVCRLTESDLHDLPEEHILSQLQQAAILRAVFSPNQLRERMADFWTNHFNIYARKGQAAWRKPGDELGVVREHALGRFPDLLKASAHSPAMLAFLDNQVNRKGVPNENYARELMELHTLGVHGGYTQRDVREVARCFTGWSIERRFLRPRGKLRFIEENHDEGPKTVLGQAIQEGGIRDGERVLEILASYPSTARFVGGKVARYFLGQDAGHWELKLAEIFASTGGDVKAMLRPLLLSEEMRRAKPIFKRPFDYVVSSIRSLDGQTDGGQPLQEHLERMGQPLYQWPMPDGYPDKTSAWTGSMLARWSFSWALANGEIGGTAVDLQRLPDPKKDSALKLVLAHASPGVGLGEALAATANEKEAAAISLASPEFQWR